MTSCEFMSSTFPPMEFSRKEWNSTQWKTLFSKWTLDKTNRLNTKWDEVLATRLKNSSENENKHHRTRRFSMWGEWVLLDKKLFSFIAFRFIDRNERLIGWSSPMKYYSYDDSFRDANHLRIAITRDYQVFLHSKGAVSLEINICRYWVIDVHNR